MERPVGVDPESDAPERRPAAAHQDRRQDQQHQDPHRPVRRIHHVRALRHPPSMRGQRMCTHPPGGRASWPERGSPTPPHGVQHPGPRDGRPLSDPPSSNGTGGAARGSKFLKVGGPGETGPIRKGAPSQVQTWTTWAHRVTTASRCSGCSADHTTTSAQRDRPTKHEESSRNSASARQ